MKKITIPLEKQHLKALKFIEGHVKNINEVLQKLSEEILDFSLDKQEIDSVGEVTFELDEKTYNKCCKHAIGVGFTFDEMIRLQLLNKMNEIKQKIEK